MKYMNKKLSCLTVVVTAVFVLSGIAQNPDRRPAGIPRSMERPAPPTPPQNPPPSGEESGPVLDFPLESRSIDGAGNNLANPLWGTADSIVLRLSSIAYEDGLDSPAGGSRSSARAISNAVCAQTSGNPNDYGATDYLWQWGQFLDHDIVETPTISPAEPFDILVPTGDPWFDPTNSGAVTIPLNRSLYEHDESGVRQQITAITAFIDASNVYGSDDERAFALRTLDGTGKLKTSDGELLPFDVDGFFLAGDVRANEQIALTAMHTLFVREHNHWTDVLAAADSTLGGEDLYQMARTIVAAEMQAITYREFLPLLLGRHTLAPYQGYNPNVDPAISNVFGAAAYRVGHTMLSSTLLRIDENGDEVAAGHIALANAFFNPDEIINNGIDSILRGLASQSCQQIDCHLIDDVRNFLFGPPGSGGFDLASLNIQRGRDHGLPDYNQLRVDFGLPAVTGFDAITGDPELADGLAGVYETVDEIDAWVGLLAEPHLPGAMVGETLAIVLGDQFTRLRDGDRFFYQHYLSPALVSLVENQPLSRIIRRNTEIGDELPNNVFVPGADPSPLPDAGPRPEAPSASDPIAQRKKKRSKRNNRKNRNRQRNRRNN